LSGWLLRSAELVQGASTVRARQHNNNTIKQVHPQPSISSLTKREHANPRNLQGLRDVPCTVVRRNRAKRVRGAAALIPCKFSPCEKENSNSSRGNSLAHCTSQIRAKIRGSHVKKKTYQKLQRSTPARAGCSYIGVSERHKAASI